MTIKDSSVIDLHPHFRDNSEDRDRLFRDINRTCPTGDSMYYDEKSNNLVFTGLDLTEALDIDMFVDGWTCCIISERVR